MVVVVGFAPIAVEMFVARNQMMFAMLILS